MAKQKHILLTFDLEEFDLPLEFNCPITPENQMRVTNEGLKRIISLLDKHDISATFFVTSRYALANQSIVQELAKKHEIASHSHDHSVFEPADYLRSKQILEDLSQSRVVGFRMPRLAPVDYSELVRCGYTFDSSLNPTWIPGRYNHFSKPRVAYKESCSKLTILPTSVSPLVRFPLFWMSFKNIPLSVYSFLCSSTIKKDGYLHLYFHPWEFADLSAFNIPSYIKRLDGDVLTRKLDTLLAKLKKKGTFCSISSWFSINKNHV